MPASDRQSDMDARVERALDSMPSMVSADEEFGVMHDALTAAGLPELLAERDRLRQIGDELQSVASRMAEYLANVDDVHPVPYEVRMAAAEAESAVRDWTEARAALQASDTEESDTG